MPSVSRHTPRARTHSRIKITGGAQLSKRAAPPGIGFHGCANGRFESSTSRPSLARPRGRRPRGAGSSHASPLPTMRPPHGRVVKARRVAHGRNQSSWSCLMAAGMAGSSVNVAQTQSKSGSSPTSELLADEPALAKRARLAKHRNVVRWASLAEAKGKLVPTGTFLGLSKDQLCGGGAGRCAREAAAFLVQGKAIIQRLRRGASSWRLPSHACACRCSACSRPVSLSQSFRRRTRPPLRARARGSDDASRVANSPRHRVRRCSGSRGRRSNPARS